MTTSITLSIGINIITMSPTSISEGDPLWVSGIKCKYYGLCGVFLKWPMSGGRFMVNLLLTGNNDTRDGSTIRLQTKNVTFGKKPSFKRKIYL